MTTSHVCSAQNSPAPKILELIQLHQYQDAYQLSIAHLNEWEGDVQFDFSFALAAKSIGNLEQAVFAFERVIASEPTSIQGRYFLAISYFDIGNLIAAQHQFELIKLHPDYANYSEQTTQYLNAINQRIKRQVGHWKNWAKLSTGYDSNPNNGIKDEFIDVPLLGNVRLFEQSQQIESMYTDAQLQLLYITPQNQQSAWYAGVDIQNISFEDSYAWSRTFLGASAGYNNKWQEIEWELGVFYRSLSLDGDAYLDYAGLNVGFSYLINEFNDVGIMLMYAKESYEESSILDKKQNVASIWFSNQISKVMMHKIDFRFGVEDASEKIAQHIERDVLGVGYQYHWQFSNNWQLMGKLDYLETKNKSSHPLFGIVQQDKLLRVALEFEYHFASQWRAGLAINHMRNSSNILLYDYDRNKLQLSLQYAF